MSNPWRTTPADIGLMPLFRLLNALGDEENEASTRKSTIIQSRLKPPTLVEELRELDEYIIRKRDNEFMKTAYELRPELKHSTELVDHLTELFYTISIQLDAFNQTDALKNSYVNAFKSNQIIWDDISQENKAKLVNSIRSAIDAILRIFKDREQTEVIVSHQNSMQELIKRTNVFDETKEFDDYYLEDLYDLLTECVNALELIRKTSPNKRR